jgi:hypothetical protein
MCFPWTIGAWNHQAKRYDELMHLHEKPKGRAVKILAAGQPCKIGECNRKTSENNLVTARGQTKAISSSSLRTQGPIRRGRAI